MKKRFCICVLVFSLLLGMCEGAFLHMPKVFADSEKIKVIINGNEQSFDTDPVMINDRVMVPMRAIFESFGAVVSWDNDEQKASAYNDFVSVSIGIGKKYATVNGKSIALDSGAVLVNDRTMVPVRFVSESFGASVLWNNDTNSVEITYEKLFSKKMDFEDGALPQNDKDYVLGGAMKGSVLIEMGIGKSGKEEKYLKVSGFETKSHRFKFADIFPEQYAGNKYYVSFWVRTAKNPSYLTVGAYGMTGTDYATRPVYSSAYEIDENWSKIVFAYDSVYKSATMLGMYQNNFEISPDLYIDDIEVVCLKDNSNAETGQYENVEPEALSTLEKCESVIDYKFDDWTEIKSGLFAGGANYSEKSLVLSDEHDINDNGKSLKFANREQINHRIKIANAFSEENVGKKYVVSMWIYIPDESTVLSISTFSVVGTKYAYNAVYSKKVSVKKGEWTQVAFTVDHTQPLITMVGIEQGAKTKLVKDIYIDNIKIGVIK